MISDSNGNTITLSYNGTILSKITDGAGRVTTLNVTPDGYLIGITDPAGRTTSFSYTGSNLTAITYPDGKQTLYTYDSNNNLTSAKNYDGYTISYQYYNTAPYRISTVTESHTDGAKGGVLKLSYGYNITTFTDFKGRSEEYQFNDTGNTVCIKGSDGKAAYYKYDDVGNVNKLTSESKLQNTTVNYLLNHNAEIPNNNWDSGYWGSISLGTCSFTAETSYLGNYSFKVDKTTAGDRLFYGQTLNNLQKGNTYTLSGYIKTSNISNKNNNGAALFVNYQDSTGKWITVDSNYVNGTNNWQRYDVTFTLPSDAASNTVYVRLGIAGETGTAYFDCLQLESGSNANRYNLVENSDFMYGGASPAFWNKNAYCDSNDNGTAAYGKNTFKINGYANKAKNIYQTINVSGKSGDIFVLSGWANGASVPTSSDSSRYFALDVGILKNDGTYQWETVPFNYGCSAWQYTSDVIIANGDYKSITVYGLYYNNSNTVYFSDIQLYKEQFSTSYQHDTKGNVISTIDLANQTSKFTYDGNNNLISSTDAKGNNFNYSRDDKRNITKASTAENVVYSFSYDSYGNPLQPIPLAGII